MISLLLPDEMSQHARGRSPRRPSLIEPTEYDIRKHSTVNFTATCENVWYNLQDRRRLSTAWSDCPTANKPNIGYACMRHYPENLIFVYTLSDVERTLCLAFCLGAIASGPNFDSYIGVCNLADARCIHALFRDVAVLPLDHCFATT